MSDLSMRIAAQAKMPKATAFGAKALAHAALPTLGPLISLRELSTKTRTGSEQAKLVISHVFVLMLENRSFDHMLGFSPIKGLDLETGKLDRPINNLVVTPARNSARLPGLPEILNRTIDATPTASYSLDGSYEDPAHEFASVSQQFSNIPHYCWAPFSTPFFSAHDRYPAINMQGFVQAFVDGGARKLPSFLNMALADVPMRCFAPEKLPVINRLASSFAVCDQWHASLPGPTVPNRLFVHAASSGGYDDSPSSIKSIAGSFYGGVEMPHGTIYDRLDEWEIYVRDKTECTTTFLDGVGFTQISDYDDFEEDINDDDFKAKYVFIEPNYNAVLDDYSGGDSMHPVGDVRPGEKLIRDVYLKLRSSAIWEKSVLIVTFDEHGGFYDHVAPPSAVPPGDDTEETRERSKHNFDFSVLGPRVPTIIISPYVPEGIVDGRRYDHSSVPASVCRLFDLKHLTQRDAAANDIWHLFTLESPRTETPGTFASHPLEQSIIPADIEEALERVSPVPNDDPSNHLTGVTPMIIGGYLKELKGRLPDRELADLATRFSGLSSKTEFQAIAREAHLHLKSTLGVKRKGTRSLKVRRSRTGQGRRPGRAPQ